MSDDKEKTGSKKTSKKAAVAPPKAPRVSFEMYARAKGLKPQHWAGMKAFAKRSHATMEEWESALKGY